MTWVFEVFEMSKVPSDFDYVIFVEARTYASALRKAKAATLRDGSLHHLDMGQG